MRAVYLLFHSPLFFRLRSLAGLPAILASSVFLVDSHIEFKKHPSGEEGEEKPRPKDSGIALSEWSIFLTIALFFLLLATGV